MPSALRHSLTVVLFLTSLVSATSKVLHREDAQKLFNCPPCFKDACVLPSEPCELVLEPGICGCCPVCARKAGSTCGVAIGRCGMGLKCMPDPDDKEPLRALLLGRALCTGSDPYEGLFDDMVDTQ